MQAANCCTTGWHVHALNPVHHLPDGNSCIRSCAGWVETCNDLSGSGNRTLNGHEENSNLGRENLDLAPETSRDEVLAHAKGLVSLSRESRAIKGFLSGVDHKIAF